VGSSLDKYEDKDCFEDYIIHGKGAKKIQVRIYFEETPSKVFLKELEKLERDSDVTLEWKGPDVVTVTPK